MSDPSKPDLQRLRIDRGPSPTRSRGFTPILVAAAVFAVAGFLLGRERPRLTGDSRPVIEVARVARAGTAKLGREVSANGYVVARRQAALSTEVQGRVVELRVEEGSRVREGEILAVLDTKELEAGRARTRAQIAEAEAALDLARVQRSRAGALVASGHVAVAEGDTTEAAQREADARLLALRAALRELEVRIAHSSIRAPFAGVITRKNAEVGEVVSAIASGGANSRSAVVTLVDFDSLEIQVELAQTSLGAIRVGGPVRIYLDAYPDLFYQGEVRQILPTADRQKSTVEVRCSIADKDGRVLPEMGVRTVFLARSGESAVDDTAGAPVVIPVAALAANDPAAVFVFDGARARRRNIGPGETQGGVMQVLQGLTEGEFVVLSPPPGLEDGAEVRRKEEQAK